MSLTSLVFVKQVPDTKNISGEAMKADGTVNRGALPAIFNPEDLNALELALSLKDRFGGRVAACTMGPPGAVAVLRHALYMGADEAILLTDRKFAAADTLATSYALACAARRFGHFDLVLCGRQAIDGDTAQVGPQVAEKLDLPQITYVEDVLRLADGRVRVRNLIEGGTEVCECPLPALFTVGSSANTPRPAGARRLMRFKKAVTRSELLARHAGRTYEDSETLAEEEARLKARGLWIHEWSAADVGADDQRIGGAGSPTKVKKVESVVLAGAEFKEIAPTEAAIGALVQELIADHVFV
ncbi:MAG: electron transfer flavoprotein subunit beta/FixA family protein [Deltaproteobacteria bacterium]|nr:electron transfer flavoprotein subunit beta/FixA family protein [Deltaproteobacteria bacterium]